MNFETIIYEKKDAVAVITINREKQLNAINGQTSRDMQQAWEDFRDDPDMRVAILTGVGEKAFSTGMDLVATAQGENQFEGRPAPFGGFTKRMPIFKPIIAAINGYCLAYEDVLLTRLMATEDAKEGPRAFAEKRKPEYTGR